MMITKAVLDSSAVIAAVRGEPGGDIVRNIGQVWVSAVNFAELVHVMARLGYDPSVLEGAPLDIQPLDQAAALDTGLMLNRNRAHGLSLGDCACLALAKRMGLPAVTADGVWSELDLGVEVVLIR